jgi:hypothetical protein
VQLKLALIVNIKNLAWNANGKARWRVAAREKNFIFSKNVCNFFQKKLSNITVTIAAQKYNGMTWCEFVAK